MISHRFEYHAPATMREAFALLDASSGETAVLAGGTWLVPNMTCAKQQPGIVLDAKRLELNRISEDGEDIVIGALATYKDVLSSELVRTHAPLLFDMAGKITGGPQIVGQGTIGGSACFANPSSDVPACLAALRARLHLGASTGERQIDAGNFYTGPFQTVRLPTEILTEIRIEKTARGSSFGYHKLKFSTGSWPIVTAACVSRPLAADRLVHQIAIGGANAIPVIFNGVSPTKPTREDLAGLAERAAALIDNEWSDELARPGYRRQVAPAIALRALMQSVGLR
jgi:aerobic carbon-monoxide dehydrogenase medium subunit